MSGSTTQINDEANKNKADDGENLDRREPEFAFTKDPSSQKVDDDDGGTRNGDPHSVVYFLVPVYECFA